MDNLFAQYLPETIVALGLLLLAFEIAILGLSTFILFFMGLALVLTGSALWLNILPHSYASVLISTAILTLILAVTLWQPFKKMQSKTETKSVDSDFTGERFFSEFAIAQNQSPEYKFSGIMWKLRSNDPIPANTEVEIVKAEVGILWVKAV